jgi:hypothetical protein
MFRSSTWGSPRVVMAAGHGPREVDMQATAPWWDFVAQRNIRLGLHKARLAVSDLDQPWKILPTMLTRCEDHREPSFRRGGPLQWYLMARRHNSREQRQILAAMAAEAFEATDMLGRPVPVQVVDEIPSVSRQRSVICHQCCARSVLCRTTLANAKGCTAADRSLPRCPQL